MPTDLLIILLAFVVGAVSVLTPCIAPMLPIILGFSSRAGRRRAWGIVVGIEISFIGISLLASAALAAVGLPPRTQEIAAAIIIGLFAIVMLVPAAGRAFARAASKLVSHMPQSPRRSEGFFGGLGAGLGLGLVWAPCAGPLLASITVAANHDGFTLTTLLATLAYGAGMFFPLLGVMIGGRAVMSRLQRAVGERVLDISMGTLMIVMAVLIGFGGLTKITRTVAETVKLTSTPTAGLEQKVLNKDSVKVKAGAGRPSDTEIAANGYPATGGLVNFGPAPEITGIHEWYNTPGNQSLDLKSLRGKVVLIDFWTYSCINCIRTLPTLRAWYDTYEKDGLVIIGVHTPEFAFEKDEGNVRRAISDLDVTWPVATDPGFRTWNAYHNRYWPAKYLIDREGNIRFVHYGEGKYDATEQHIRELLDLKASSGSGMVSDTVDRPEIKASTPETYLGYERLSGVQYRGIPAGSDSPDVRADVAAMYHLPNPTAANFGLGLKQFGFAGSWNVGAEQATAVADGATLTLRYQAARVFLVLGPPKDGSAQVRVTDSGAEGASRTLDVDKYQLYTLRDSDREVDGTVQLTLDEGVSAYAFTFG